MANKKQQYNPNTSQHSFTFKSVVWFVLGISVICSAFFVFRFEQCSWESALLALFISFIQLSVGILVINVWLEKQKTKENKKQKQEIETAKRETVEATAKLFGSDFLNFNKKLWNSAIGEGGEYNEDGFRKLVTEYAASVKNNQRGYQHLLIDDREKIKKIILNNYKDFKPLILKIQIALEEIPQLINWNLNSKLFTNTISVKSQVRDLLKLCDRLAKPNRNGKEIEKKVEDRETAFLLDIHIYSRDTLTKLDEMSKAQYTQQSETPVPPACFTAK